jgi:tRNA(fMet)-specific endonuclease VapC
MIIADTDVLIDAMRGVSPARERIALELRAGTLATTSVTAFELASGARRDAQRRTVEQLLRALSIIPLDAAAARDAAELRRALEAQDAAIGMADCLIAGICRTRAAILLTRNRRHFERVPGLRLGTLALDA